MSDNPILKAIKTQSKLVIPIVKALEEELGREPAHRIVGDAIAKSYAEFRRHRGFELDSHPGAEREGGSAFPITSDVVDDTASTYGFNVKTCEFADYFRSIGEPEIGALMTCGVDYAAEELVRPSWMFERTQTLMQGAAHCDFRWKKSSSSLASD